ncbi:peptidylprolyl isomerase [Paenibacillus filicis]|uniref:peptidylprolyl isomerase n=1 Tax=Paenibacillus gyeongsangnamensis TaxID=3388067 RepID=A0ABT4QL30_9BACL|nr:peptidylprolyl isomerase [Paenibacillus filicis]MCZ8517550.1 peptidylprolyl isomerase [Paenibacillus filicis]
MLQNNRKPFHKGLLALLAILLVVTIVATGCGKKDNAAAGGATPTPAPAAKGNPSDVLVTYKNGGKVTRGDFDKFLGVLMLFQKQYAQFKDDPSFQQEMMNQYLTMKILASRADDKAKAEADKQAKDQLAQIKTAMDAQQGGSDKLLKDANLTQADLDEFVKMNILAIVSEESKVTDQDLQAAYKAKLDQDKDSYTVATVDHILIGTSDPATGKETRSKDDALKRAKEVKSKLDQGGDFTALAKEYSEDPGSKDKGGQYKDADISQWVPEFKKAAAELPIGKISDPVETSYGYHVMKVESRKTKTFDDVKDELKSEAAQTKMMDFATKELPGLIETNNLPKPAPTPAPTAPAAGQTPAPDVPKTDAPKTDAPKTDAPKNAPATK